MDGRKTLKTCLGRRNLFAVLVCLNMLVLTAGVADAADPNLVAHWKLDEGSGTTAYDSAGSNHGTLINGPVWTTGQVGGALSFDGVDDYVDVGNSPDFDIGTGFAVALWFKANPTQFGPDELFAVIDKSHRSTESPPHWSGWVMQGDIDSGRLWFGIGNGTDFPGVATNKNILDDVWHHIAGVFDGSNIKLYLDGVFQGSTVFSGTPVNNSDPLNIGRTRWQWRRNFNGKIDDVRIYDRALSAEEVREIYLEGSAVAHWKFDEGSGTTAYDSAGDNDGTIYGAQWTTGQIGGALSFDGVDDYTSIPALNLNSNTVTISAWIKRHGVQEWTYTGIVFSRDGSTCAGLNFGKGPGGWDDINHELSYHWNDDQAAWDWDSGLFVPDNEWVFVALVVEPTKATIYLNDASATNVLNHDIEEFNGITRIGNDEVTSRRSFKGTIDDVRIYDRALSAEEVREIYLEGSTVAHWRFDEGSGTTAYDSAGDNDGTLMNGPQWTSGRIGGALRFDGSDDWVSISNPGTISSESDFTWVAWIQTSSDTGAILARAGRGWAWERGGKVFFLRGGRLHFDVGWVGVVGSGVPVNDGQWHHAVVRVEFVNGSDTISFYVDGVSAGDGNLNVDRFSDFGLPLKIGFCNGDFPESCHFNGKIDDVRIYGRALYADEIMQLYGEGLGGAYNPEPEDGASVVDPNVVVSWEPGTYAASHDVYFGTDFDEVKDATTDSPDYMGRTDANSYWPGPLELGTSYYWRIDEVNDANTNSPWKGDVWRFKTWVEPNFVGWWKLDEGGGTTAYDSAGENDGTLMNGPAWTSGRIGGALEFDGVNDQVKGTWSQAFGDQVTLAVWFKSPGGGGGSPRLIEFSDSTGHYYYSTCLAYDRDGSLRGWVTSTAGIRGAEADTGTQVWNDNNWHHAVYKYGGSSGSIYVDGVEVASATDDPTSDIVDGETWVIGALYPNTDHTFNGIIDDVRIYDRALFAGEIMQLYQEGIVRAYNPEPADGARGVDPNVELSWTGGAYAASHDVYFGTDFDEVKDATTSSSEYMGNQEPNSWDPCGLDFGATYYWRIDEVNDANTNSPWKGDVWSFTTWALVSEIVLDHFWRFKKGNIADAEQAGFDDSGWRIVSVPHDWSIEDLTRESGPFDTSSINSADIGYTVGGTAWYRKTFSLDANDSNKIVHLQFDGVYMNSDVWVNGTHVGNRPYGYSTFWFDITDDVIFGAENVVAVEVKNEGKNSRWYSGSGIFRPVGLTIMDKVHVEHWGPYITTPVVSTSSAEVRVRTEVKNESDANETVTLHSTILDSNGVIVATDSLIFSIPGANSYDFNQTIAVSNPDLWSLDSPMLYTLWQDVDVGGKVVDHAETTFGIRSISFDATNGFLLNGESVLLQGGCMHHDNYMLGSACYERAEERRVEVMKAAGYNAIRTAHNPPSPAFLYACDRLGVLVIDEAFDMWNNSKRGHVDDYAKYFASWWQADIDSMVLRDRNHPSIIMWSIGNEIPEQGTPEGTDTAEMLATYIRSLDATRPVTAGVNGSGAGLDDYFATLDVVGYNYRVWEYTSEHSRVPDRVMYGSESFAEDAYYYWEAVEDYSYVIGDFVWTGHDYLGETSIGWTGYAPDWQSIGPYPWHLAYCGDIDACGYKRPAAYYRDVLWKTGQNKVSAFVESPTPSLPDYDPSWHRYWTYPDIHPSWTWPWYEGTDLTVTVYSACEEVKLFLNGQSLGTQVTNRGTEYKATYYVNYQPGELKAVGYVGGIQQAEWILNTTGVPATIRLTADKSTIAADGSNLCYVTAELFDGSGNVVYDPIEDKLINFEIEGDGKLAGVGNANPYGTESFQRPQRMTFKGRCVVVLKSTLRTGTITLTASSSGLTSDSVVIQTTGGVTSNTAPVANDDSYSAFTGETLDVWLYGVISNDMDSELDPLSAILVSNVSKGTLTLNPDGTFEYTPDAGFIGTDTFTYRASDGEYDSNVATVTIKVKETPPGIMGWWKFDEGSGTTAYDSAGINHGTLNNMDDSNWVEGHVGTGALEFDGSNDYVSVPALGLNSKTVTITAWIKRNGDQNAYSGIVFSREGSTIAGLGFGNANELRYNWNDDREARDWHSELIVPDNKWVFVALVVEPTQATLYMGENGILSTATNVLNHDIEEFDGVTRIGSDSLDGLRHFKGTIDDVRIYDRALSPVEIGKLVGHEPGIIYVDGDATGNNDGSSWNDAFNHLQDALRVAWWGDEIRVAEGIYKPDENTAHLDGSSDRYATFQLKNGVTIYGGFPSGGGRWAKRDPNAYETMLSGDLNGDDGPGEWENNTENSYNVVTGGGTNATAVLDGFTITGGNANGLTWQLYCGGGMYNSGSSPTVTKCTFSENWADLNGGGMYNDCDSAPTVTNCMFSGNWAGSYGSGMFNEQSSPTVTNCTFSVNWAGESGGGVYCDRSSLTITNCIFNGNLAYRDYGGGVYCDRSRLTITNCIFNGNLAYREYGGGVYCNRSSPRITDCIFSGNWAYRKGGGVYCRGSGPRITNCIFSGNLAYSSGGGMFNGNSSPMVTNCTFSGNSAGNGGGMRNNISSKPALTNCILWANSDSSGVDELAQISGAAILTYCCIQGYVEPGEPQIQDLICHWKFDEGSGSTAYDTAGDNDGTIYGAQWTTGRIGGALSFDGVNDYVGVPDSASLDITDEITLWAWVLIRDVTWEWDRIVVKTFVGDVKPWNVYGLFRGGNSRRLNLDISTGANLGNGIQSDTDVLALNEWTHVAGTFDGSTLSLFVNGELIKSHDAGHPGHITTNNIPLSIGANNVGKREYLNGKIDEVRIYDEALSAAEILQLYQYRPGAGGNTGADPCFVDAGYWADACDPNIIVEPNDPNAIWVEGDYHLLENSPCIDAGDPNYIAGPDGTDLDGDPRVVDGDNDGNSVVDMGAYERIPEPSELILDLADDVMALNLQEGIENSLEAKLDAALEALGDENENNDIAAINTLGAFINAVEAQRGKKIPEAEADVLIAAAQEIIELLSDG